jgi:hypothetical protein
VKRRTLVFTVVVPGCLLLLGVVLWLSLQSAFVVNRVAYLLEPMLGYRVRVEAVSFSPTLHGRVSGLKITSLDGKGPSLFCSRADINGTIKNVINAEVEKLVLTGPKLFFRLDAGDKKADLSALEKLPPVQLLVIEQGEVEVVYETTQLKLTNLGAEVKAFSPRAGGRARFEALVEVTSRGEPAATGHGRCKGQIDATGPIQNPSGTGSVELLIEAASLDVASVRNLLVASTFRLEKNKAVFTPVRMSVSSAIVKSGGRDIKVDAFTFSSDAFYEFDSGRFVLKPFQGKAPGLNAYKGFLEAGLKGDMGWKAGLEAPSVDFTQAFSIAQPFLPDEYRKWTIQGAGSLETSGEGVLGGTGDWKADVKLSFREGGFRSGDASKAGQRITGTVTLKLRSGPEDKRTRFDLAAEAGDGEFLWGKYYKDFKGEQFRVASVGSYGLEPSLSLDGRGTLDLFNTGQYTFSGQIGKEEASLQMSGKSLSHQRLFSVFLKDYLRETYPRASGLDISGQSHFDVRTRISEGLAFLEGTLRVDETALAIADLFSVSGMTLSLPFDLVYPSVPPSTERREGEEALLGIKRLHKGSTVIENVDIPFILSQNSLRLLKRIDVKLYGGEVHLPRFEGQDILSPERVLSLALSADHLDLGLLTEELLSDRITGTINADLPGITFRRGRWSTKGQVQAGIFGGSAEVTSLFGENLFSAGRRLGGDVSFRDISLEEFTRKVSLGKVTGIVKGSVAGLVIEYGQPARFFFDVESDPTGKVSQVISVDAVENLSILGTGSSGISAVLNSGVNKFFKEYPYSWIGILCTLENDTFRIRGKKNEGGKEYLVRRGWLRGLDVIIQDTDNAISFRDMQERIGRIFHSKQEPKKVS